MKKPDDLLQTEFSYFYFKRTSKNVDIFLEKKTNSIVYLFEKKICVVSYKTGLGKL